MLHNSTCEKLGLSGTPPGLAQEELYVCFRVAVFDPKALTDPPKYFDPKQPIPEPTTHTQTDACKKKTRPWLALHG